MLSIADPRVDDVFERNALQMASLSAHHRCRVLGGQSEASSCVTLLTPREVECMRWVLKGKSDTDIGEDSGHLPYNGAFSRGTGKEEARRKNPHPGGCDRGFPRLPLTRDLVMLRPLGEARCRQQYQSYKFTDYGYIQ